MKARCYVLGVALFAGQALIAAVPTGAEPFGLVEAEAFVPAGGLQGPVSLENGLVLYRNEGGDVALCDPNRGRNLADLVIELQMAQTVLLACSGLTNPHRTARIAAMRALALPRYAARAGVALDAVETAFETRAAEEVELVTRCGVRANEIVADVADDWYETRLREAMEADRLPASNCPSELR